MVKTEKELCSYLLRLGGSRDPREMPKQDVVEILEPVFDEDAAYRRIDELKHKMAKETDLNGDTVVAARYQHEIVVLRQQIIENMKKHHK